MFFSTVRDPVSKNQLTLRFRRFRRVAGDLISHTSREVISLHLIWCFLPNASLAVLWSLNRTRTHGHSLCMHANGARPSDINFWFFMSRTLRRIFLIEYFSQRLIHNGNAWSVVLNCVALLLRTECYTVSIFSKLIRQSMKIGITNVESCCKQYGTLG